MSKREIFSFPEAPSTPTPRQLKNSIRMIQASQGETNLDRRDERYGKMIPKAEEAEALRKEKVNILKTIRKSLASRNGSSKSKHLSP